MRGSYRARRRHPCRQRSLPWQCLILFKSCVYLIIHKIADFSRLLSTMTFRHKSYACLIFRDTDLVTTNLGNRQIREEIQAIINLIADKAQTDGFNQDAAQICKITAHNMMTGYVKLLFVGLSLHNLYCAKSKPS